MRATTLDPKRRYRPLIGGCSIANRGSTAGTYGGVLFKGGQKYLLSNYHVFMRGDGSIALDDPIVQPGPADGGVAADEVGKVSDFPTLSLTDPNPIDAALAEPSVETDPEEWILGIVPLKAAKVPTPGEHLISCGRNSYLDAVTEAQYIRTLGINVQFPNGQIYTFMPVYECYGYGAGPSGPPPAGFIEPGRSGSRVWSKDDDWAVVGLAFAGADNGSAFVIPATAIEEHLKGSFTPQQVYEERTYEQVEMAIQVNVSAAFFLAEVIPDTLVVGAQMGQMAWLEGVVLDKAEQAPIVGGAVLLLRALLGVEERLAEGLTGEDGRFTLQWRALLGGEAILRFPTQTARVKR